MNQGVNPAKRRFLGGAVAAAAMAGLPAGKSRAQTPDKLTVGLLPVSGNGPLFIAQERGYFREEGVDVDLRPFDSGGAVTLAVAARSVDMGAGALNVAYYNLAAKGVLTMFAGGSQERPKFHNSAIIVTNAAWDAGMKSVRDMKGARVGLTGAGGGPHFLLAMTAEKYGVQLGDMKLDFLQSTANQIAAFKGGQIDALEIPNPSPNQLEAQHLGHIISWVGDETPTQIGITFSTPDTVKAKRPMIEKYLRAYVRGSTDYNRAFNQLDSAGNVIKGPGYDETLDLLAHALNTPRDALAAGLTYIDPKARFAESDIAAQVAFFQQHGFLTGPVDLQKAIDRSFGTVT